MEIMKRSRIPTGLLTLALAGTAALFTGCMTQDEDPSAYQSDGQSAYLTSEVDQMGQVYDQIPSTVPGAKAAAKTSATGLAITGELVIDPFHYDETCTCFIRHATYSGSQGFERDRLDSVTLFDADGATLDHFDKSLIAKIVHSRNVTKSKDGRQADIRFDITAEIMADGDVKKGVWNGTMTGSFDGKEFKSAGMTQVTRVWQDGRFRFPESGEIELDRPIFHFLAEFTGDGKAKVTIKNKVTRKIHILFVDKDYHESDPVDQP